ncbi:MAG: hypothetical protein K2N63_10180 [Lachnospiraceae bacterium]|nr:hypothetical protein [Lachnospiraceae bacterium]
MKKYDLSGEWLLWLDEEREGKFEDGCLSHAFNDVIMLPATTAQAKKTLHGENIACETGFLTERYPFCGYAWYQRTVRIKEEDVGCPIYLYLERTRMARVFVNGVLAGSKNSICAPHRYDIGSAVKGQELTVTVCVDNTDYPTKGGHMTSPDTQTNWNGILGKMELQVFASVDVLKATAESDALSGEIKVTLETLNTWMLPQERELLISGEYVFLPEEILPTSGLQTAPLYLVENSHRQAVTVPPGHGRQTITVKVANIMRFSEFTPCYGQLHIRCVEQEGELLRPIFEKAQQSVRGRVEEKLSGATGTIENTVPNRGIPGTFTGKTARNIAGALAVDVIFGFRDFTAGKHHFYINGVKTFLRGKHDGMIFPQTGAAPMGVEDWLKVMRAAKRFGINHYRFHTCCPPEAAFFAADLLGIYMEPELPFWGTIAAPGEEGYNGEEQDYLIAEGFRMMEAYGSHPSFVMMSLGNELWGSKERLGEIIEGFRAVDRRHLYTSGSNNFQFYPSDLAQEDFFVGVRFDKDRLIRGSYAMCDAPQGFVQTQKPNTVHDYDVFFDGWGEADDPAGNKGSSAVSTAEKEVEIQYGTGVKKVKTSAVNSFTTSKPVISHEVGQYCTYPDFKEIGRYTGVLAARNFEVFRKRLAEADMVEQAEEFFRNSGALAAFCYKLELEAAHRSRMLAGYQLLDIQDFSGQGTALVGVLNARMEEKGIIGARQWRGFCAPTVVLAALPQFVYAGGDTVRGQMILSHYGAQPLRGATLHVMVTEAEKSAGRGMCVKFDEEFPQKTLVNGVHTVGELAFGLPKADGFKEYLLTLSLCWQDGGLINQNTYSLYAYPKRKRLQEFAQNLQKGGGSSFLLCGDEKESRKPEEENNQDGFDTKNNILGKVSVYVTDNAVEAKRLLLSGSRVLFFPQEIKEKVQGTFCTDFWCYPMFRSISESVNRPLPVGTLGLSIREGHPALHGFGSHTFSTPQWYDIVTQSDAAVLDRTAIHPIVQTIDNFERNHKLGTIFEAKCMGGSLLVCTARLQHIVDSVAAQNLYESLVDYAVSEEFAPKEELTGEEFDKIFK